MASSGKDHPSSDSSLAPSTANKDSAARGVTITYHLRDRELLRKRREEALEKYSSQWVMRVHKNEEQNRGRRGKRGRGCQSKREVMLRPEPTINPQPELQKEAEQVHSESAHSEPALPEPVYQEQLPMMTIQNPASGMQPVAVEGEPAARSLDSAGEGEVVKPAEEEILELFNTSLENDHEDNQFNTHVLY